MLHIDIYICFIATRSPAHRRYMRLAIDGRASTIRTFSSFFDAFITIPCHSLETSMAFKLQM